MPFRVPRDAALAATGCAKLADFLSERQFESADALVAAARAKWWGGGGGDDGDGAKDGERIIPVVVVTDWLQAFDSHPRIGNKDDLKKASERERGASEARISGNSDSKGPMKMPSSSSPSSISHAAAAAEEQAGAASASQQTRDELSRWNSLYERRFGHIYIVCASGRSGEEMLADLRRR
jgi:hypothetical protein